MQLTSIHCRAQELVQRDRAETAQLDNVRIVAERAAAWGLEALAAEKREARHLRTKAITELAAVQDRVARDDEDLSLSQGPDRGIAQH